MRRRGECLMACVRVPTGDIVGRLTDVLLPHDNVQHKSEKAKQKAGFRKNFQTGRRVLGIERGF